MATGQQNSPILDIIAFLRNIVKGNLPMKNLPMKKRRSCRRPGAGAQPVILRGTRRRDADAGGADPCSETQKAARQRDLLPPGGLWFALRRAGFS